jgi:protein involved in polysaccharide export with SLBB domain
VIAPDGRIDLGALGRPRVEGKTAKEMEQLVAERADAPANQVHVQVAKYQSQQVYLVGEVAGAQRAVPYQGPEKVTELLQRAGGLKTGAAVGDVHVVRTHVLDDRTPEVFHVDLQAVVMKHEDRTNITIQPFDQVYVGESRQSSFEKLVPPVLQPVYRAAWGLK